MAKLHELTGGDYDAARPTSWSAKALGRRAARSARMGEGRKEAEADHPLGGSAAFFEFNATAVERQR